MTFPRRSKSLDLFYLAALLYALSAGAAPVFGQTTSADQGSAAFQETPSGGGWGAKLGYHDDYRRLGLVYETPAWWSHESTNEWGRLELTGELGAWYWEAQNGDPDSMWQASATPMLRWWPNEFFYTEIGVGLTVLSRTHFADKDLGTAFQFGNHIGVGALIGENHRIGLRYSHFSNAGIKEPNPGLDLIELSYTYQY